MADGAQHAQHATVRRSVVRAPGSLANVHVVLDSKLVFSEPHVVPRDALALASHEVGAQLRPLFLAPRDGQAAQVVVAEPREANDPARAALLPPLPRAALAFQPEQSVNGGFFAKDYRPALALDDDKASAVSAVAKPAVFPKAQTLIGQGSSIEERRDRLVRKMPPPRPPARLLELKFDKDAPSLSAQVMEKVVLGADTLASIEAKIFNKVPAARRQLELLPQEVLDLQAAEMKISHMVAEREAVTDWLKKYKDQIEQTQYLEQGARLAKLDEDMMLAERNIEVLVAEAVIRAQNRLSALPVKAKPKGPPADLMSLALDFAAALPACKQPPPPRPASVSSASGAAAVPGGRLQDFPRVGGPVIEEAGDDEKSTVSGRQR